MKFRCPHCQTLYKGKDDQVGQKVVCQKCRQNFTADRIVETEAPKKVVEEPPKRWGEKDRIQFNQDPLMPDTIILSFRFISLAFFIGCVRSAYLFDQESQWYYNGKPSTADPGMFIVELIVLALFCICMHHVACNVYRLLSRIAANTSSE